MNSWTLESDNEKAFNSSTTSHPNITHLTKMKVLLMIYTCKFILLRGRHAIPIYLLYRIYEKLCSPSSESRHLSTIPIIKRHEY
jgi:hypothetical protein